MGKLDDDMVAQMRLRGFALTTQEQHTLQLRALAAYFCRSPAELDEGEVHRVPMHVIDDRKLSASSHEGYAAGALAAGAPTGRRVLASRTSCRSRAESRRSR